MSALTTRRSNEFVDGRNARSLPRTNGRLSSLPVVSAVAEQRILAVWFRSPDGRSWRAIGGGATVAEAISSAREACPDHTTWDAFGWNDLYGD
jgi:hypothetical protein